MSGTKEEQGSIRKQSDAKTLVAPVGTLGTVQQDMQTKDIESQCSSLQSPWKTDDEPASKHQSSKFNINPRVISDAILGLSDGLTVPFALTAGLSAFGNARLVVLGGLAELIAGAISMGLGGFVGAKSEAESYQATKRKCQHLVNISRSTTSDIVQNHFRQYHLGDDNSAAISKTIHESPETLIGFLMTHHFDAAEPPNSRPWISALTLAAAYFSGGFIPLIPYFAVAKDQVLTGLWWSIGITGIVLLVFGYVKTGIVRGWRGQENILYALKGALQMGVVGAAAAGAAIGLVRAINNDGEYSALGGP